jgi:hypothetical protein
MVKYRHCCGSDPFETDLDPAFHFDTDPDPAFQFDKIWIRLFQRGNKPKSVLFIHFYLIFLVSSPTGPKQKAYFVQFPLPVDFVVLIRVA